MAEPGEAVGPVGPIAEAKKKALEAMLRADGRPPPVRREDEHMRAEVRPMPQEAGKTVIGWLEEVATRDAKAYGDLIQSLRDFAAQKRADLEYFERLLGNVERPKR